MKDNIEKMELIKPADVTNHIETASIKELEEGIGIIDGSNHMFSELRTVSNNIDSNVGKYIYFLFNYINKPLLITYSSFALRRDISS